jgi:hypothetical protein
MVNKFNWKERIVVYLLILAVGLLSGMAAWYFSELQSGQSMSSRVEKVTEKQVYLENSSSIEAIKRFSTSLVNVFPESELGKYTGLNPDNYNECFEKATDCANLAVTLTSDGLVIYGGQWQEKEGKGLLARDLDGKIYQLDFQGKIRGMSVFNLVKQGELALAPDLRTPVYNHKPVLLGDLKLVEAGQKVIGLDAMFGSLIQVEEGIITKKLNLEDVLVDLNDEPDPMKIGISENLKQKRFVFNLAGQLLQINANDGTSVSVNQVSALLARLAVNEKSVNTANIGLRCLKLDKTLAQKMNLKIDYGCLIADGVDVNGNSNGSGLQKASLAEKSGFRTGDIVMELDGKSLLNFDLTDLVMEKALGQKINFSVFRNGKIVELPVQI